MSRPFALAEITDLGRRAAADPPLPAELTWSGLGLGEDELRALHAALHPTLVLATLAGWEPVTLDLFSPASDEVLEVDLDARAPAVLPPAAVPVAGLVDTAGGYVAAVAVRPRPGLLSTAVDLPDAVVPTADLAWFVLPLGPAAGVNGLVDALGPAQVPPTQELAQRIALAAIADGPTATGLVSLLDPGLWDFPDAVLAEGSGADAEALRNLGRPIVRAVLRDANSLLAFLLEDALGRTGGGPLPTVHGRLTNLLDPPTQVPVMPPLTDAEVQKVEGAWQRAAQALHDLVFPDPAARPPFRRRDVKALTYTELVLDAANHGLFGTVAFDLDAAALPYGGLDLRYTRPAVAPAVAPAPDHDPDPGKLNEAQTWVYEGVAQTATFADAADMPRHVQELREDLAAIGFGPLADGDVRAATADADRRRFGPWLEAAVREFQTYAACEQVARRPLATEPQPGQGGRSLGSTLVPVTNDHRRTGPLSGALDVETRELLRMWVERDWHCPVVVEARSLIKEQLTTLRASTPDSDRRSTVLAAAVTDENVWLARQVTDQTRTMVVWDHTGRAAAPPYRADQPMALCRYIVMGWNGGTGLGSDALGLPSYLRPEAEITLPAFFPDLGPRDERPSRQSTYRAIRAVAEQECMGYFDGLNGWDTAITSAGPLHQTLGLMKTAAGNNPKKPLDKAVLYPGELGGFLEYFAAVEPAAFQELFGRWGVAPVSPWQGAAGPQFVPAHRKYTGFVSLQAADGTWVDLRRPQVPGQNPVGSLEDPVLAETFKTWHWTHRVLYASRTSAVMAQRMWEFSAARVRELLSTTWRVGGAEVPVSALDADGNGISRPATLADLFTSERTVAPLVRQHVYNPPHLFGVQDLPAQWTGATVAQMDFVNVVDLYDAAVGVNGQLDPGLWGDAEQNAMAALMDDGAPMKADGLKNVAEWPNWLKKNNFWSFNRTTVRLASASPVVDPLPNLVLLRGGSVAVNVVARTASAFPVSEWGLDVSGPAGLQVTALGDSFLIEAAVDADLGRFPVTVSASDGRYTTTLQFDLDVSDTDDAPSDAVYTPVLADPELDPRHGSFLLDADDQWPFPPPP